MRHTLLFAITIFLAITANASAGTPDQKLRDTLRTLEIQSGGRIGVAVLDTNTGEEWLYKAEERFPIASTFKAFACAAILAKVDRKEESLSRNIFIPAEDMVTYSPVTENHVGTDNMTLADLCEATITLSDNTAANLILGALGGPAGFTGFMRASGDSETRLDRWETALNEAIPGDPRDTTTPHAAATSLATLAFSETLSPESRDLLIHWMRNDKVADALLRSILPSGWEIADKTGAAAQGSRGIIAIMWPPTGKPLVTAIYLTETELSLEERNRVIANIGTAIIARAQN